MSSTHSDTKHETILKEFEIEKQRFWIQTVEEYQKEFVANAMANEFMRDEPLSMYWGPLDAEFTEKVRQSYIEILRNGISIVCMTIENNKPIIAGIQCLEVESVKQPTKAFRIGTRLYYYMLAIKNIFNELTIEQYLIDRGLYVFPDYRKKGIGCQLLECWLIMCKHTGYKLAIGTFSSLYSQAAARKAGLVEIAYRLYEEMRKDSTYIPLGVENHTKGVSLFVTPI